MNNFEELYVEDELEVYYEYKCIECKTVSEATELKSCSNCKCTDLEITDFWEQ